MIPIGIVTRDRHAVLDVTLRSLSAANLPDDQVVIIYDDGSVSPTTLDYLYTNKIVSVANRWPTHQKHWQSILGDVKSKKRGMGLDGKIKVVRLGKESQGVVAASCDAFRRMIESFGTERGIIMVQDDVVFNEDWLERMQAAERKPESDRRPVGLIAGCWINHKNHNPRKPMTLADHGGVTAQCYYVTPAGIKAVLPWASQHHTIIRGFDNKFCANIRSKADVYRMCPAVCQHIGLQSLVRPNWKWRRWSSKGRIDFTASGPYPLAKYVREFKEE